MNRIQNGELARILSRHYNLTESDATPTLSSEIIPVAIVEDFKRQHAADNEVNRGVYDALQATASGIATTFELFNPPGSGVIAEVCSFKGGVDTAGKIITLNLATTNTPNPHAGAAGIGKFLHTGSQNFASAGNSALVDGFDVNRLASINGGGGFIAIAACPVNAMIDLMVPGCPIFLVPGTALRLQVSNLTGQAYWSAAWIERRNSLRAPQ